MASVLNFIARAVFVVAAVVLLVVLLGVGLVVGLVWWLVATLTGGRKPQAKVWVNRMQQQAQAVRRRAQGQGEVVEAEVREIR
jgi:hypothetical protein